MLLHNTKVNCKVIVIVILALLPLALWLWMDVYASHPYWLVRGDSEQDMAYTAWSWWAYREMDYRHPGVPVFLLHGWIFGMLGGTIETIPKFLFWSHGLVALFRTVMVIAFMVWAKRRKIPFSLAVVTVLLWMSHPTFLAFAELLNTDSYLPVLSLLTMMLAWDFFDNPSIFRSFLLGISGGILLSTKFSAFPLIAAISGAVGIRLLVNLKERTVWHQVLLFITVLIASFSVMASYPQAPGYAWPLVRFFLSRADVGWHITSLSQFANVWKHVLHWQDLPWLGVFILYITVVALFGLVLGKNVFSKDMNIAKMQKTLYIVLLLIAWIYTFGAQVEEPSVFRYILSIGYRLRNTYIPAFGLIWSPLWIYAVSKTTWEKWRKALLFISLAAMAMGWGTFLHRRSQVYRLLEHLHIQTSVMFVTNGVFFDERYPIAVWTTKGLPIVNEAAFHWEGNYHPGKRRFTAQILQHFPDYWLFDLRAIPPLLETLPPPPTEEDFAQQCRQLYSKYGDVRAQDPIFLKATRIQHRYPTWIAYWTWEAKQAWHLTEDEIRWSLCLYGYPEVITRTEMDSMEWVVLRLHAYER